jgi:D-alanyl-D-alanine carboxypeptidase
MAGVVLLLGVGVGPTSRLIDVAGGSPAAAVPVSSSPASGEPGTTPSPSPSPFVVPTPAIPTALLQARLDALRTKLSIPGVSVAILWNDGRTWLGVSGMADVASKTPVTTDSGFALASISKTFTAAVVLQLVDEGRLTLDERVAPLLPAYRLDARITVRMLLDHTSGLPDFFANPKIDPALQSAPDELWTPARSFSFVAAPRAVPGSRWTYSNTNYLLLGELVTAVTGRPLATEVRQRLLNPIGLTSTWYQEVETPEALITTGYRMVAGTGGTLRAVRVAPAKTVMPFRSVVTAAGGAGSMAATALDTARWMRAFAGGHVLSENMQQVMIADIVRTAGLSPKVPYGLGIQAVGLDGYTAFGHSGRYLGFENVVRYLPVAGVTIAVLTNQSVVDPATIEASLLGIILPPVPTPSPTPSPSMSPGASPAGPASAAPGGPAASPQASAGTVASAAP